MSIKKSVSTISTDDLDWQENFQLVSSRNNQLLNNPLWSDIIFQFPNENNYQISAHRIFLSTASRVFAAMSFGNLSSTKNQPIDIVDIPSDCFMEILRYIYTDIAYLSTNNVSYILFAANKYMLKYLEQRAINFILSELCIENVCTYFEQCYFMDNIVSDMCLNLIIKFTSQVIKTKAFYSIEHDTLMYLLKMNELNASEKELFAALVLWSDYLCIDMNVVPGSGESRRKNAGDAVYLIRFPAMDMESFLQCIQFDENFLTDSEIGIITKSISNGINYSKLFSDKKRRKPGANMDGQQTWRHRYSRVISPGNFLQWPELFKIRPHTNIQLNGFSVYGMPGKPHETHVKINIVQITNGGIFKSNESKILSLKKNISCDGSDRLYKIMLDEPIQLQRMANYHVSFCFKEGYYFHVGCSSCKEMNNDVLTIEHDGFSCRIQEMFFTLNE